jgi:hypothetical protein
MTKTANIELESTPVEKNPNNKRLAISSSAIVVTGTLFGSAFVPLMGTAAPIASCRFSELEIESLRTELENTLTACREIELYWHTAPSLEAFSGTESVSRWDLGEGLYIPFGKDLRIFSNDSVTFTSTDKGFPFIRHGIGVDQIADEGYRYENIGTLEIDGIGFYSLEGAFSAIFSNQNVEVKNSVIVGAFSAGIVGHDITVNNSLIGLGLGFYGDIGIAAVYSLPGISQSVSRDLDVSGFVDRSDILSGSVELTYNTFLSFSEYDVVGLGMKLTAEGNIFGTQSEDLSRVHVINVDPENEEDFAAITGVWGPEFEDFTQTTSSTYRAEVAFEPISTEWFTDSYNIFSSVPGVFESGTESVARSADINSREGVLFDVDEFIAPDSAEAFFFGGENNSYSLLSLAVKTTSPAARFVTNPLFPQTQDLRRQTRTIPYSAGAVEQNGRASGRSSSAFVFGSERYEASPARLAGSSGRKVTISAPSLPEITEVRVGGKKVKIVSSNGEKLVFIAPKGLRGAQDILLKSNSSELLLEDQIFFTNSKSIRGFADSSAALNPLMKSQIRTFLKQNPHATSITCQGYASLPANPRDKVFGTKRGKAVCAYVASLRPNMKVTVLSPAVEKKSGPAIRRTVLKVIG